MRYLNYTATHCLIWTCCFTPCLPLSAETRPDYSGVWRQINDRCVPKPKDKHASYRLVIEQNGAMLRLGITTNKGSLHLDYAVAGKELVYTRLDGDQFHTKVQSDRSTLI